MIRIQRILTGGIILKPTEASIHANYNVSKTITAKHMSGQIRTEKECVNGGTKGFVNMEMVRKVTTLNLYHAKKQVIYLPINHLFCAINIILTISTNTEFLFLTFQ